MKQRPIIFSTDMVRAILAGKKTQTRRVVKPQPEHDPMHDHIQFDDGIWCWWAGNHTLGVQHQAKCPYGVVGDQLWVRETYATLPTTAYAQSDVFQKTDESDSEKCFVYKACFGLCDSAIKWLTPLFMPRAASRILLEITAIRVERVQDISNADIRAEGACDRTSVAHRVDYEILWGSINGKKHPWSENPWVWVVEFKRIHEGGAA